MHTPPLRGSIISRRRPPFRSPLRFVGPATSSSEFLWCFASPHILCGELLVDRSIGTPYTLPPVLGCSPCARPAPRHHTLRRVSLPVHLGTFIVVMTTRTASQDGYHYLKALVTCLDGRRHSSGCGRRASFPPAERSTEQRRRAANLPQLVVVGLGEAHSRAGSTSQSRTARPRLPVGFQRPLLKTLQADARARMQLRGSTTGSLARLSAHTPRILHEGP